MEYVPAKTILSGYREQTEWFGCHYNMNLYRGCCHGCIYCDSRSECYGIEDFDRVRAKKEPWRRSSGNCEPSGESESFTPDR